MTCRNRLAVLTVCGAVVMSLLLGMSSPVQAATYNWKLASVLPDTPPVHQALVTFADKMKEKPMARLRSRSIPPDN